MALIFSSVLPKLVPKGKPGLDQSDELTKWVGGKRVILCENDKKWHSEEIRQSSFFRSDMKSSYQSRPMPAKSCQLAPSSYRAFH